MIVWPKVTITVYLYGSFLLRFKLQKQNVDELFYFVCFLHCDLFLLENYFGKPMLVLQFSKSILFYHTFLQMNCPFSTLQYLQSFSIFNFKQSCLINQLFLDYFNVTKDFYKMLFTCLFTRQFSSCFCFFLFSIFF